MTTNNEYKSSLKDFILYVIDNNLVYEQIYDCLASFDVDRNLNGEAIIDIKKQSCEFVENYLKENFPEREYFLADQGHHFRHINATFDKTKILGQREFLKLYIPIKCEQMTTIIPQIYKFMVDNRINFQSKVSGEIRNELFVVRANKNDAIKIINFCIKNNFDKYYNSTNPFLAHVGGIGIGKDIYNISYNQFLAQVLANYSGYCEDRKVNRDEIAKDFQNYCATIYNSLDNSRDKYIARAVYENIYCINNDDNILRFQKEKFEYKYDHQLFSSYQRYYGDNKYFYKDKNGNMINEKTNYNLYVKLQAMNCLSKIYAEQMGKIPSKDFIMDEEISNQISDNLEYMLDAGYLDKNVVSNFKDYKINELLPYLYADFARKNKETNIKENQMIVKKVKENMIVRVLDLRNKNKYHFQGMDIISSIPPIQFGTDVFALEYLQGDTYNITTIYNDEVKKFENVVLGLDKQKLINNSIYREQVALSVIESVYGNHNENNAKYTA